MAKKDAAPELTEGLYPLPFDPDGKRVLTFRESVAIARALEKALIDLIGAEWRWTDLHLAVLAQVKGIVTYEVVWNGNRVGTVTVESKPARNLF
ncbi:MAG: hypothetical protein WBW84_13990 [Acidobacteriaceae bacterium]